MPKNCCILAWFVTDIPRKDYERFKDSNYPLPDPDEVNGLLRRIECVMPWEDNLNPLRWCDTSTHPIGYHERVTCYAWVSRGYDEEDIPDEGQ